MGPWSRAIAPDRRRRANRRHRLHTGCLLGSFLPTCCRLGETNWRSERDRSAATGMRNKTTAASKGRTAMQRIAVLTLTLALTLALTAIAAVPKASADPYPSRPIRLIIGFP